MVDVAKLLEAMHPMREPPPPAPILPYVLALGIGCVAAASILLAAWRIRRRRSALLSSAEAALSAARRLAPAERLASQAHLLRRVVRSLAGETAARSSGDAWLQNLDRTFATRFFTEGAGVVYGDRLYKPIADLNLDELDKSLSSLIARIRPRRAYAA